MFRELLYLAFVIGASSEPCDNFSRLLQVFVAFYSDMPFQFYLVTYISDLQPTRDSSGTSPKM